MTEPENAIELDVVGGLCRLRFIPNWSCGADPNGNPGFEFQLISDRGRFIERDGKFIVGSGVIKRDDLRRLADAIEVFLFEYPPVNARGQT